VSRLSEKQLLILTIGITVLLAGGLGFLIWSDFKAIEEEEQRIAQLQQQIQSADQEIAQIPQREYRVIANREISDKEVAFLPEESEIETFWEVLERFAEEAGVRISEIAPADARGLSGAQGSIQSVAQLLSLRGSIDQFLRFINLVENYDRIINVIEYSVAAGDMGIDGKARHGIRLALTTFTYSKKIANTIVSIPQYEKKKEHPEVKKWLGKIKIQEKETYTLRTSLGRRDPFVNVRRKVEVTPDDSPEDKAAQEAMVENLVEMVQTLRDGLEIEAHLREINDLFRLAQQRKDNSELFQQLSRLIDQVQRENLLTIREYQERFRNDVLLPFEEIKAIMSSVDPTEPRLTPSQVDEWTQKVTAAFEERDWKKVEDLVRAFMEISKNGDWVEETAREGVVAIADTLRRARVIQKFEKRRIKISTILFSPNAVSVAVINSKQLSEGDALDGDGRVVVFEIGENYVIFETEGVEIKKTQNE